MFKKADKKFAFALKNHGLAYAKDFFLMKSVLDRVMSKTLLDEWDIQHSWHPFTQMQEYLQMPRLHVERGEGCWLFDNEGNRYLDTNASLWTNVHGHNDAELNTVLREQIKKIAHSTYLGLSHPRGAELSSKLVELAPANLVRVMYSDNGSTAVEIALKLSFQYWQLVGREEKQLVVGMQNAYHGDTFGAMAAGDNPVFHGRFNPWFFQVRHFPSPVCVEVNKRVLYEETEKSLSALEDLLKAESPRVACVVIEPSVQGAAGMKLQPPGFLKAVKGLCRQYEVHLILDEVFVGFGRLGSFFICRKEGVEPDFLCLAKGLTAGYLPLAATLVSESIYEPFLGPFESYRAFFHGHTFSANPLAAAVALKSIEKLEKLIANGYLEKSIAVFGRAVVKYLSNHPNVREVRQRGMTAAADLCRPGNSGEHWPIRDRKGLHVCLEARNHGLLMRPLGDTLLFVPPLIITEEEIDILFQNCVKAMDIALNN